MSSRFGYHEPPMNSVDHLHLHCFVLPISTKYLNDVVYGYKLCSTKKLIARIHEKFPIPTKATDIVEKIDPESEMEQIKVEKEEKVENANEKEIKMEDEKKNENVIEILSD